MKKTICRYSFEIHGLDESEVELVEVACAPGLKKLIYLYPYTLWFHLFTKTNNFTTTENKTKYEKCADNLRYGTLENRKIKYLS